MFAFKTLNGYSIVITQWQRLSGLVDPDLEPPPSVLLSQRNPDRDVILPHSVNVGVDAGVPLGLGLARGVDGGKG